MKIKGYKPRIIDSKLDLYLKLFGSVLIEGPKWCGKTWCRKNKANSEFLLAASDGNFNNKNIALMNPELALSGEFPHLIDEWQEVPSIWDAVRNDVGKDNVKGKYILIGSATIKRSEYIHSGCGRIAKLRMRPMSLYEMGHSDGRISLKDICNNTAPNIMTGEVKLEDILQYILTGGWPSLYGSNLPENYIIAREYINTVLSEDIDKTDEIKRDRHKMELLLRSLARNEATTCTNKKLKDDIKSLDMDDINVDTIADYLSILNRLYLIENIPPFASNLHSSLRVKQNEKKHFVDPSLVCTILSLTKEKLINNLEFAGFLFESLVERDFLTYVDSFNGKLYHYQDYENNEIDSVIELEDGSWCGVEIKLGAHQIENAAINLIKINNKIIKKGGKGAQKLIVICGLSNAAYERKDGVYVVPLTSLKN